MGPVVAKLMTVDITHTVTITKIITVVLANIPAPIKQTIKLRVFINEQYRKRHQLPSGSPCSIIYPVSKKKFMKNNKPKEISEKSLR